MTALLVIGSSVWFADFFMKLPVASQPRSLPYGCKITELEQPPQLYDLVVCLVCHVPRSFVRLGILQDYLSGLVRCDGPTRLIRKPAVRMLYVRRCEFGQCSPEIVLSWIRPPPPQRRSRKVLGIRLSANL
ncbi:MAG: hypothetical protein U1G07_05680 [Verrucomicrobiota bacterium]